MFKWLRRLLRPPRPAGPPSLVRSFSPGSDPTLSRDAVSVEPGAWKLELKSPGSVRLFEVEDPGLEQCLVHYRASLRCEAVDGRAYLEMWCHLPGRGEFFSKGIEQPLTGTCDWTRCEIPFWLLEGQRPDRIKLNVCIEGTGLVYVKDVELLRTPLV